MPISLKPLNEAFTAASRSCDDFTEGHKEQLDNLKQIVAAINAEGNFRAGLANWMGARLGLEIGHKDDKDTMSFLVSFGRDDFSASPTTVLSASAARTPVGDSKGYCLQIDGDRDAFLKDLGEALAQRSARKKLEEETLAYATGGKAPAP